MSNLNVAAATLDPFEKTMSVIDDLKRLERLGSEHSETTKKLIDSAHRLAAKINDLFPDGQEDGAIIARMSSVNEALFPASRYSLRILPEERSLGISEAYFSGARFLYNQNLEKFVAEDRESALRFSEDIAKGLLGLIAENLELRLKADSEALPILDRAFNALSSQKGKAK